MGRILVGNLSRVTGTQGAVVTNPCFPSGALRLQPSGVGRLDVGGAVAFRQDAAD